MRPLSAFAWSVVASAAAPALRIMLRRRVLRGKEVAARLAERRGIDPTPRPAGPVLWLHAASVGEAVSALPLLCALPKNVFTVFTTGTVTSARLLETRLKALGLDDRVKHRFVPLDVPAWARRFVKHWQPDAACFLESELWPNIFTACRRQKIPMVLINARISGKSERTWRRVPGLARYVLGGFAWIAAQSEADAARFRALGATRVDVPGNLKLAAPGLPVDRAEFLRLSALLGERPRWLAASTHPADDALVARVHKTLLARHANLLTAVAPRHPERGEAVAAAMGGAKRRSLGEDFGEADHVWVADTLGEMGLLYRLFPVVFMGKSFFAGGGQNFLEPARLGCAVATGPRTQNFAQARDLAVSAGALSVVETEEALIAWLDARLAEGARVPEFAPSGDVPAILAARLLELMKVIPPEVREPPVRPRQQKPSFWQQGGPGLLGVALSPVSGLVAASTARRVAKRGFRAPVPVICCGNAGVGGAGKTTVVLDFCRRLQARGLEVHVLTRGYGGSARGVVRVDPALHGAAEVGDEALLLAAVVPTWKAVDRAASATSALAAGAQILVMDDGLQNPTLVKTASVLVIDGGYGFGNGRVLPAGPLREPVRAAASRCMGAVLIGADEAGALASLPPGLPVFAATLLPGAEILELVGKSVVAFAGIGRPEKFFTMLRQAGVEVARSVPFPDHHVFAAAELVNVLELARDLDAAAVTTPKDFARIPASLKPSFRVVSVSLAWADEPALNAFLDKACTMPRVA